MLATMASPMPALRAATDDDLPWLGALNNAFAAEVNALSPDDLAALIAVAAWVRIADDAAFLLALSEATPVQGPNHARFVARELRFLYVDRVVVAAAAQGRGLGRALYGRFGAGSRRPAAVLRGEPRAAEPREPRVPRAPRLRALRRGAGSAQRQARAVPDPATAPLTASRAWRPHAGANRQTAAHADAAVDAAGRETKSPDPSQPRRAE